MPKTAESLIQIYHSEMAGVEQAKKALWALLRSLNAGRAAKLTVTTVKGSLKVCLEESFTKENMLKNKSTKRVSPSHLRRKERRAADPAVRQRAAQHQAREAATAPPMEEALRTPEKERRSSATSSLQVSPVKDDTREEAGDEQKRLMENNGLARFPRITMNMQIIQSGSGSMTSREETRPENSWVKRTGVPSVIMNAHHQLNLRTKVALWGIS